MTTTFATPDPVSRDLLALAATGRPRPAIDYVLGLIADGRTTDHLILEALAEVQREVGRRWQANSWTVAQEHAATAVVDAVLGAVSLTIHPATAMDRGSVLVACVEDEYHSLPARMGAERLRHDGWDVTFLGANVAAKELQRYVVHAEPDEIVLSCTMSLHLPAAARCVSALAELGCAVVVAGAAFGHGPDRADRVGASAWIGPDTDTSTVLGRPLTAAVSLPFDHPESQQLELRQQELVQGCLAGMSASVPAVASYSSRQLASTASDLVHILRYLALAIDLDESHAFEEFVVWLAEILASRSVPARVLLDSLAVLGGVLERGGLERSAALCSSAQELLGTTSSRV